MASEDVIELGSSDDEAEPAPKKIKPRPNAMVHIPTKLHGVTIKPATSAPFAIKKNPKELVTMTKIQKSNTVCNPFSKAVKINGIPQQKIPIKQNIKMLQRPVHLPPKAAVNPVNIFKKLNTQVVVNKIPTSGAMLKNPIRIHSPQSINSLPPGITVKRTSGPVKRPGFSQTMSVARKKIKLNHNIKNPKEVLTVELDDDDSSAASAASPQWYLRPEDSIAPSVEKENNKEPEPKNLIEITIEDSPVKPTSIKQTSVVGAQFEVTIEDSPVKITEESKHLADNGSEEEMSTPNKVPHSKKKLEYPKESNENKVIEIEIEPVTVMAEETNLTAKNKNNVALYDVVEIEESPIKEIQQQTSTPKKDHVKLQVQFSASRSSLLQDQTAKESDGFHPVYQRFIDLCFELENSEDMKKIIDKKVKTYYKQVPKEYTESEEFIDMVSSKILAMKAGPEKMYLYIKDIVDELNMQRKMAKSQVSNNENKAPETASDNFLYGENSEFDSKRQRQIRKLEKTLKKLHRAIQKLEEQEVDFDDDEDSVYLLTERYKERMVRVHAKFCQLTNTKMPSEPRVQIDARPGQPPGPAKRLEKWINKKVPIGMPLPFPDFHDVLRCVREANESDKLGWNEADIMEEARDLFTRCGKKLQRRRQENEWRLAASRISSDMDPAENNDELKLKLENNRQLATKKEAEVFNKYADKQNQLKLEPEEIGDKEAEESPIETEDDEAEAADEALLENKNRRKERLKRLLQEKSKKTGEENQENNTKLPKNSMDDKENSPIESLGQAEVEKTMEMVSKNQNSVKDSIIDEELKDNTNKTSTSSTVPDDNESKVSDNQKSYSDYEDVLESDIDELHLLQKLHSENEIYSSSSESSGSESPIAISDTLDDSDDERKDNSDVISIEDSSYSDSETDRSAQSNIVNSEISKTTEKIVSENVISNDIEMESIAGIEKNEISTNNNECTESIEDVLLASTDDEADANVEVNSEKSHCVNMADDHMSIGETVIDGINKDNETINGQNHQTNIVENNDESKQDTDEINSPKKTETINISEISHEENKCFINQETMQQLAQSENRTLTKDLNSSYETVKEITLEEKEIIPVNQESVTVKCKEGDKLEKTNELKSPDTCDFSNANHMNSHKQDITKKCSETKMSNIISGENKSVDMNVLKENCKENLTENESEKSKISNEIVEILPSNLEEQQENLSDLNNVDARIPVEVDNHSEML
ncbi:daxx-like protein [Galleria mellonella]|uniref:Daxx-like protein n=1 Tax=Galleria mellonella TaxID=7137 RepID=A0A6J1X3C4_GALME|nr:daxx-like protein [Galleria mellonella]